mmetsp:Transcript_62129/g.166327  ORF Transcript_62129/g.166327 Transcript_62129/m.166327 type:complete len:96 (+) Transcript_62129:1194-1481(+)
MRRVRSGLCQCVLDVRAGHLFVSYTPCNSNSVVATPAMRVCVRGTSWCLMLSGTGEACLHGPVPVCGILHKAVVWLCTLCNSKSVVAAAAMCVLA